VKGWGKVPGTREYLLRVRKRLSKGQKEGFPTEWITDNLAPSLGVSPPPCGRLVSTPPDGGSQHFSKASRRLPTSVVPSAVRSGSSCGA
jgi:hypothetical protein